MVVAAAGAAAASRLRAAGGHCGVSDGAGCSRLLRRRWIVGGGGQATARAVARWLGARRWWRCAHGRAAPPRGGRRSEGFPRSRGGAAEAPSFLLPLSPPLSLCYCASPSLFLLRLGFHPKVEEGESGMGRAKAKSGPAPSMSSFFYFLLFFLFLLFSFFVCCFFFSG